MGSNIALSAVAVTLAVQSTASPLPSEALKPSSAWNVELSDGLCLLQRQFGTGEQAVTLGFKPGTISDGMRLLLARRGDGKRLVVGEAKLEFDDSVRLAIPYFESYIPNPGLRLIVIDVYQSDLPPLAAAKQVRIRANKQDFTLELAGMPAAMKALDSCESDLLVNWGMEPAVVASIASHPKIPGGLVSLFRSTDYPVSAIRKWEEGTSGVRLWVGKDGKARDCTVIETSGSATLDRESCSIIIKRGKFEPARTATGEAIESITFQRVRWELPR